MSEPSGGKKDNTFILTGILIDNTDEYLTEISLQPSQSLKWWSKMSNIQYNIKSI